MNHPSPLPPAPLYPGNPGLYDTDVFITSLEGYDIYWAPESDNGTPEVVVVWGLEEDCSDTWCSTTAWIFHKSVPESVKRFAESIYRLHV